MRNYFPSFLPLFVVIIIILSRRPLDFLRRRGATSPDTAQPVDEMSAADRRRLDRLVAQGVVREASPGRFYYDREAERAKIRRRMPWLIGLAVVLLLVAVALMYWAPPRVRPMP